jgi:polyisoprenoid-binding protein YceI
MRTLVAALALILTAPFALAQTFVLSEGSEARFLIDEVLLGRDKTVVGVTPTVTGELTFDLADPQATMLGTVSIDARTFVTDDNRRNNAIRDRVLQAGREPYRFITFAPTAIEGLPEAVQVGDTFALVIVGDLTIRGAVREVAFDAEVTVVADGELQGLARTEILYRDFDLSIPRVPIVARVEDEVVLELAFTAVRSE